MQVVLLFVLLLVIGLTTHEKLDGHNYAVKYLKWCQCSTYAMIFNTIFFTRIQGHMITLVFEKGNFRIYWLGNAIIFSQHFINIFKANS